MLATGSLESDTPVTLVAADQITCGTPATLSPEWEIWGLNGGYLAAVAMRAAGSTCGRGRPASINAHVVGRSTSGAVDIDVDINRTTQVATSTTVRLTQDDRPVLVATV